MIAILVFLVAAIGFTVKTHIVKANKTDDDYLFLGDGWLNGAVACWVGLIGVIMAFCITYTASLDNYAKLIAYHEMISDYEATLDRTTAALIPSDDKGAGIRVESMQHSSRVSDRIVEIRNYTRWYKETLGRYREYDKRWFIRQWIAKIPEELAVE